MVFENQCVWSITISYNNETKTVSYPLTCEFNIERNNLAQAKYLTVNIYNLGASTRESEFFRHDIKLDLGKIKIIEFSAGYNGNLITCFRGLITEAYSSRRGTETITTIQATDAGYSGINLRPFCMTFKAGTSFIEAFNHVANKLEYIQPVDRGILKGEFKTDTTLYGTPLQILNQITNNHTFVDNSQLYCLNNNESISDNILVLSAQSGLLDVPIARNNFIVAKCVFNPSVRPTQRVEIKTTSLKNYNGVYRVFSINHQGVISGAISGQRITTLGMMISNSVPNSNVNITAQTERQGLKLVDGTEVYTENSPAVENAYQYIRDHSGAIPPWKINQRISWAEMIGHSNSDEQRYHQLTRDKLTNCVIIANKLKMFCDANSSLKGEKIIIESGWRSLENNASCGGDRESEHLKGSAIDFRFLNISTQSAYENVFNPQWDGFTYPYRYGATGTYMIHVQTGLMRGTRRQGFKIR